MLYTSKMLIQKYNYTPINRESVEGKRLYTLPDGSRVPSVTTILDRTKPEEKKQALANWRKSVGEKRESSDGQDGEGEQQQSKSNNQGKDDEDGVDEDNGSNLNRYKESQSSQTDQYNPDSFEPTCETDEAFRANESGLVDEKCKPYVYVNMPTPNLSQIVTPAKRVQELMTGDFDEQVKQGYLSSEKIQSFVQDFRNRNERYIALLAKEFEMRKAATSFSKAKQSDTGDIDVNKLASYRFDDNIFRKIMQVPKGKSHGLILLLDYSGSMADNMAGSIEQILVLSMFCRKVNIPFQVYAFSNDASTWNIDYPTIPHLTPRSCFSHNLGEMRLDNVSLREYLKDRKSTRLNSSHT